MHEDERRDPDLTRKMMLDEFVSNPEELHRKYYGLVERDRRAREKESAERNQGRRLRDLEQENEDLTRRLASAHGALDAYRKESRRLKDDLERIRGSRSMRIGRVFTKPASVFRRSPAPEPGEPANPAAKALPRPELTAAATDSRSGGEPGGEATWKSDEPKLWELTDEQLAERLATEPRVDVLNALLNRVWFQQGGISACETMLADHEDLVAALPEKGAELVARIHGEGRLRRGRISVPPRAHGAAYRVEHGRIMYCVHSTPVHDSNGYSTRTRGLVDGLRDSGVDVSVVSRIGYPWDIHRDAAPTTQQRDVRELGGVEYTHLPGADLNRDPLDEYLLKAADAYVREARIRRPEQIHAASNFRQALPALIASRRLGIPFVYEVRGLWELTEAVSKPGWEDSERFTLQVELENLVAREADHVLAITAQVRDELIARGVDGDRITLVPNAVNAQEFIPLPVDREYARSIGVTLDRPVIGFAGSLVAYEGLDILLRAIRAIRDREIPVQLVIAGSGAAGAELRTLSAELGLDDDVTFLGRVPAQEIPRLMSIMDVMPCPRLSTRVTELVSPLKPLEALAAGKAVVLSDVLPQADLVPDGSGRGFLVPAGNVEALAEALEKALVEPDLARAAARAGRLWVLKERTWNALSSEIREAYARSAEHWARSLRRRTAPVARLDPRGHHRRRVHHRDPRTPGAARPDLARRAARCARAGSRCRVHRIRLGGERRRVVPWRRLLRRRAVRGVPSAPVGCCAEGHPHDLLEQGGPCALPAVRASRHALRPRVHHRCITSRFIPQQGRGPGAHGLGAAVLRGADSSQPRPVAACAGTTQRDVCRDLLRRAVCGPLQGARRPAALGRALRTDDLRPSA